MRNKAILLVALMLISLSLSIAFFFLYHKTNGVNQSLVKDKDEALLRLKDAEKTIEDGQKAISDLSNELNESKAKIETITDELEQSKSSKEEALAQVVQLKMDLEKQKSLKTELESKLAQAQNDVEKMQGQLSALETKKAELEAKIRVLEEAAKKSPTDDVELGKIIVTPETGPSEEIQVVAETTPDVGAAGGGSEKNSGLEGRVLVLNKEYNFAVISLGAAEGINIGDVFSVYHNDQYIGDLKVEKVHDSMSAAGFESQEIKDKISEGDKVSAKIK